MIEVYSYLEKYQSYKYSNISLEMQNYYVSRAFFRIEESIC